jgi:hypothetical protein
MSDAMQFPNSNMPSGGGKPAPEPEYHGRPDRGPISGPDADNLTYPSLSNQGLVTVEFPLPNTNGMEKTEKILARNVGAHISTQVERSFRISPDEASATLNWYTGVCQGTDLLDSGSLAHMAKLSRQFASASDPAEFYVTNVEPFLVSLTSRRR